MVNMLRVTTRWSGFNGGPGYTNLFFRDFGTGEGPGSDGDAAQALSAASRVREFFNSLAPIFPNEVTFNVLSDVDILEDTTGTLVDSIQIEAPAPVQGSNAASFSGPVGLVVNWKTSAIRNGRRIRGRTFLVPVASSLFGVTGGVIPADAAGVAAAAEILADRNATPDLGVWARPTSATAADGQWAVCTGSNVPLLAAVLRSRRD